MNITRTHLEFWQAYHPPSWAVALYKEGKPKESAGKSWLIKGMKAPSIDAAINAHAGIRLKDNEMAWNNLLNLLRRKRGKELRNFLTYLVDSPGTLINPEKRAAYAARILKKLTCTK